MGPKPTSQDIDAGGNAAVVEQMNSYTFCVYGYAP